MPAALEGQWAAAAKASSGSSGTSLNPVGLRVNHKKKIPARRLVTKRRMYDSFKFNYSTLKNK